MEQPAYRHHTHHWYGGIVASPGEASCIASVIVHEMKDAYIAQAAAEGAEFDCADYGGGDPSSEPCTRAIYWANEYSKDLEILATALGKCHRLPP